MCMSDISYDFHRTGQGITFYKLEKIELQGSIIS